VTTAAELNPARIERMRELLAAEFAPAQLDIIDESHRHIGHAGAQGGHGHFRVRIVSAAFAGLSQVKRHQRVYAALGEMMRTDIHALALATRTADEI
jgi:BolA protein